MKTTTASLLLISILIVSTYASIEVALGAPIVQPTQTNTTEKPAENTWVQKATMPTPRNNHQVAVVTDKIYAIGGRTDNHEESLGTNEMYDPATDTWTKKADMPTPRIRFVTAVYQDKIYCIGGQYYNATTERWQSVNATEVYDPATDTWETKAPIPFKASVKQAAVCKERIYVMCDIYLSASIMDLLSGKPDTKSIIQTYDPQTDNWTTKSPIMYTQMFSPILSPADVNVNFTAGGNNAVLVAFDDKLYYFGSVYSQSKGNKRAVLLYDTERDSWTPYSKTTPSYYIETYATVVTSGVWAPKQVYILGAGHNSNKVYNPINDTWLNGKQPLFSRVVFSAAVVKDRIYLIGGYHTVPIQWVTDGITEEYTPFGYGTVPPAITVQTPTNGTVVRGNPALNISINKPVDWRAYSIDGKNNITFTENPTITRLDAGMHNITVYAQDEYGNIGASETIHFTVKASIEPILEITLAGAVGALGFLVYYKWRLTKRKR